MRMIQSALNNTKPIGNGWYLDENDSISIKWNNVNRALDKVLQLMFCTCLGKCLRDTCLCVDNGLPCTDTCVKQKCENYVYHDSDIESEYLSSETKTIKHLLLLPHMFQFFYLQLTLPFCFGTP